MNPLKTVLNRVVTCLGIGAIALAVGCTGGGGHDAQDVCDHLESELNGEWIFTAQMHGTCNTDGSSLDVTMTARTFIEQFRCHLECNGPDALLFTGDFDGHDVELTIDATSKTQDNVTVNVDPYDIAGSLGEDGIVHLTGDSVQATVINSDGRHFSCLLNVAATLTRGHHDQAAAGVQLQLQSVPH